MITHGMTKTPEYKAWVSMKQRCSNPKTENYPHYGGRGIRVCDRWEGSFEHFLEDMGMRPSDKHSLDRKNPDGDYTPLNCRWATIEEQNNNKTTNKYYEIEGVKLTLGQISKRYGIHRATLVTRLKSGWTIDRLIEGKRIAQTFCYRGEEKTILEWATIYRIPYATLKIRLDKGIPFEMAILKAEKKIYMHDGVEKSIRRLAKEFNLSPMGLSHRLKRGLALDEALNEKKWIKK